MCRKRKRQRSPQNRHQTAVVEGVNMPHNQRMSTDSNNGKKSIFPFDLSAFAKIKLGPGLTGKISYTSVYTILGELALAVTLAIVGQPILAFVIALLAYGTAWLSNWQISRIGEKNPAAAILEGAEFIQYTQIQQAAKDKGIIIDANAEPITNPDLIEQSERKK
jgi:cytochrome oxidase assembly protein ShyY1